MIGERKLFELGFRDAYLTCKISDTGYEELATIYPYTDLDYVGPFGEMIYLRCYFQNEKIKKSFDKKNVVTQKQKRRSNITYNEEVMGYFLGYPPVAVKDFVEGVDRTDRAMIEYHGLNFVMKRKNLNRSLR